MDTPNVVSAPVVAVPVAEAIDVPPQAESAIRFSKQLFTKYAAICAERELARMVEDEIPETIAQAVLSKWCARTGKFDLYAEVYEESSEYVVNSIYYDELYRCFIADCSNDLSRTEEDLLYEAQSSFCLQLDALVRREMLKIQANRDNLPGLTVAALEVLLSLKETVAQSTAAKVSA